MAWLIKNKPILLYGYSQWDLTIGKAEKLRDSGYTVWGYIDKNAYELDGKVEERIYSLECIPDFQYERRNIQVIILLQNAQLHREVKNKLLDFGFERVLYIPEKVESLKEKELIHSYECMLEDDFDEKGKYSSIQVEHEHLYTYPTDVGKSVRISAAKEYISIVQYGLDNECDIESYCNFMKKTDMCFLKDRKDLIQYLKKQYDDNREYFRYAAIHAYWLENHFVLIDGHHRAAFLYCMGEKKIPIWATNEDIKEYKEWLSSGGRKNN